VATYYQIRAATAEYRLCFFVQKKKKKKKKKTEEEEAFFFPKSKNEKKNQCGKKQFIET